MKKEFPKINILASDEYSGVTPEDALEKSQNLLQRFGEEVDGVFAVCEPNTAGMLQALEDQGLAGKVKFVGFDPSPVFRAALEKKHMHGIVLQDPVQMGYLAVKTMVKRLRNPEVTIEKYVNTGENLATPENMKEPDMAKLLEPEQFE
ncbi:MAG: substrate-binding domain-containing protein [Planctomycetales bacterium]